MIADQEERKNFPKNKQTCGLFIFYTLSLNQICLINSLNLILNSVYSELLIIWPVFNLYDPIYENEGK
uniref:Uncharacterized protein n=1 Tax=Meloidogyne enterolobii TaxID=390850 RepID=A0A6V7UBK4_MELEN|nr:unnamed protein product [Meloidogyne enterolobii]